MASALPKGPSLGDCFGAFGRSLDEAAKSEFFRWFSLEETGRRASGTDAVVRFAPSGPAFHERVVVCATVDGDGALIALELAVARSFVDGADGRFAADIVSSLLRTAAGDADAPLAAFAETVAPTNVYSGRERRLARRFAACVVTMENVPTPGGETLVVRLDRNAGPAPHGTVHRWLQIVLSLLPLALLLHSFGLFGGEGERRPGMPAARSPVQFWIDKDQQAIGALSAIDPFWVAEAYIATVAPKPPLRFCLDPDAMACMAERMEDQAMAERQSHDPGYWATHVPGLLIGVPVTTISVLLDVYRRGGIPGTLAVLAVLLTGWALAALVVRNEWLRLCLAPFVGSALAWLLVALFALPLLRGVMGMLQTIATLTVAGVGVFTLLDRGVLVNEVWEGPLKRFVIPALRGVRRTPPEAGAVEATAP